MRRTVIRVITFIGGLYFLLEFMLPERAPGWLGGFSNPLTPSLGLVTNFVIVVGTMAFLLGPINLVRSHVRRILQKRKGLAESIVFVVFLAIGIGAKALEDTGGRYIFDLAFYGVILAFGASSMALLSFYLVSAAYRAFRLTSLDSGVMMASAVIVLLGLVPLGNWLTSYLPQFLQAGQVTQWILVVPNAAVQRAVLLGAAGGAFAAGVRHWLGLGQMME